MVVSPQKSALSSSKMRFLNHLKVSESGLKSFFLFVGYHGQSFIEGFNRNELNFAPMAPPTMAMMRKASPQGMRCEAQDADGKREGEVGGNGKECADGVMGEPNDDGPLIGESTDEESQVLAGGDGGLE